MDTHTKTTELKTQLYKMTDLRNISWLPMVCLRNNSCDLTCNAWKKLKVSQYLLHYSVHIVFTTDRPFMSRSFTPSVISILINW